MHQNNRLARVLSVISNKEWQDSNHVNPPKRPIKRTARLRFKAGWQAKAREIVVGEINPKWARRFGCTAQELRDHIRGMLKDGMTLDNYGEIWEIDHVVPCWQFSLPREIFQCFHYTNLRPRLKIDNRRNGLQEISRRQRMIEWVRLKEADFN